LFADIFNTPVATLESQEGSAYGAALLALLSTGEYTSPEQMSRAVIREVAHHQPNLEAAAFYNRRYEIFRSLYPALRPAFQAIGKLSE
jgi:sugar (pentulose or hexulose) kinase